MQKRYLKKSYDFFGHLFYFYFVKIDVVRKMNFKKNAGIVLIILSVILTLLGGIVPSKKAAKEDPVTALRTD